MNIDGINKLLDLQLTALKNKDAVDLQSVNAIFTGVREWTRSVNTQIAYARSRNEVPSIPEMQRENDK